MKTVKYSIVLLIASCLKIFAQGQDYSIVDTDLKVFFGNTSNISEPKPGDRFYGQDACYNGNQPSYTNNGNGTITDNVTGLTWQRDMGKKITYQEAFIKADTMTLGGFTDWRVPTIKELYSLILFSGQVNGETAVKSFIDENYFVQPLGDASIGERQIDAQTWSSTQYLSLTFNRDSTVFGVNFIDGRIKGYPKYNPGSGNTAPRTMYFRMVRGNPKYGINDFIDNGDGTVTDKATGLMWQKADDGTARDWENALSYAENLTLANYSDWRLPNAKELQSIVDYSRCPKYTKSAAINPIFICSPVKYPDGNSGQYPYYWTGTTHQDGVNPALYAVYIAFGEALGKVNEVIMDVHGAGAQRSDPKSGLQSDYPQYKGPQGDLRSVYNFVRCVRNAESKTDVGASHEIPVRFSLEQNFPNPFNPTTLISFSTSESGRVSLKIYDLLGRELRNLMDEEKPAGKYTVRLDAGSLASGIYLYRLSSGAEIKTMKMVLAK